MTVVLTGISKHQWVKVGKVILWLALSAGLAVLTAWVAKDRNWLATMPGYNVIIFAISQFFINEETQAQAGVSPAVAGIASQVESQVQAQSGPTSPSTPATL